MERLEGWRDCNVMDSLGRHRGEVLHVIMDKGPNNKGQSVLNHSLHVVNRTRILR